jgi:hypothetical protein
MAFSRKITLLGKTIGWNVFFSHQEAEDIGNDHYKLAGILAQCGAPPKVTAIIAVGGLLWKATCRIGGHDGVKAMVMLVPAPTVVLLPR